MVKPAPETPIDAFWLAEIAREVGLPSGLINIVPGGRELGEYLVRHPGIDKVSFTGSTAAGREDRCDQDCAAVGEVITYYVYLENTGDTMLFYDLYDDLFGGWGASGVLLPGESITYYYGHMVTGMEDVNGDGIVDDPLVNIAWVNAWDDQYVYGDLGTTALGNGQGHVQCRYQAPEHQHNQVGRQDLR